MKTPSLSFKLLSVVASTLLLTASPLVCSATTLTWDPSLNGVGSNGSGNWDNGSTGNWATGTGDTTFPTTDIAAFGVAGGSGTYTVTVNAAGVTAASLLLNAAGTGTYAFQTGKLTLAGITVNDSATFNDVVANTSTVSFATGGQTLVFNGGGGTVGTTFSGTTTAIGESSEVDLDANATSYLMSGSGPNFLIGNSGTLGSTAGMSGGLVINTGATVTNSASFQVSGGVGLITVNGGTLSMTGGGYLIAGRGEGSGQLGRVVLSTGTITGVDALVNFSTGTAGASGGELDINGGSFTESTYVSLGSTSSTGEALLNITGGTSNVGAIYFGGSNGTFANATGGSAVLDLSGGSLFVGAAGLVSQGTGTNFSTAINLSGGTIGASAAWSSSMNMTLSNANGGVTFQAADSGGTGHTINLSGVLSGTGGFTKTGAGTLVSTGANTYSGLTLVSAGALTLNSAGTSNVEVGANSDLQLRDQYGHGPHSQLGIG